MLPLDSRICHSFDQSLLAIDLVVLHYLLEAHDRVRLVFLLLPGLLGESDFLLFFLLLFLIICRLVCLHHVFNTARNNLSLKLLLSKLVELR